MIPAARAPRLDQALMIAQQRDVDVPAGPLRPRYAPPRWAPPVNFGHRRPACHRLLALQQEQDRAATSSSFTGDVVVDVRAAMSFMADLPTAMPAASRPATTCTGPPASIAFTDRSTLHPTIRIDGAPSSAQSPSRNQAAAANGITAISANGTCSTSSRPAVPCPAMIASSSKPWISTAPVAALFSRAFASASA